VKVWAQVGDAVEQFKPDFIIVSAGYDAHYDDPLGSMEVSHDGFAAMTKSTLEWAEKLCGGRVAFMLEGGYSMGGLSLSVAATLNEMCKDTRDLVLLFDDNLMTSKRVVLQLERAGYRINGLRAFPDEALQESPHVVLINLGSRAFASGLIVEQARRRFPNARVIGFCGHLEIERRREAKAAGIHKLLTNDQAFNELANLLRTAKSAGESTLDESSQ
jgi:hypothetical protein